VLVLVSLGGWCVKALWEGGVLVLVSLGGWCVSGSLSGKVVC